MIGYHYTTRARWEKIRSLGMYPDEISAHELETFHDAMPYLPERAIWVWRERLTPEQAWVCTTLISDRHSSFDLVLLEIEYKDTDAASVVCRPHPDDTVNLSAKFSAGGRGTGLLPIELLLDCIPAKQVTLLEEFNLIENFS